MNGIPRVRRRSEEIKVDQGGTDGDDDHEHHSENEEEREVIADHDRYTYENAEERMEIFYRELHNQLLTVDYSLPWSNHSQSQFVAEMGFTILDWQMIERIT